MDSPPTNTTVIVVVFVSFGGLLFLFLLLAAIWFFVKKRNKKSNIEETGTIDVEEHLKVREAIVQGPHGPKAVVLSVEDDVHVHEEINKKEKDTYSKSFCFLLASKKAKKKKKERKESEVVKVDERVKVKEEAVSGPRGEEAVVISVEDDVHVEGEIRESVDRFGHKQVASSSIMNTRLD